MLLSNPFISAYVQADGFGKGIFLALFALSVLSWVVLLQKVWQAHGVKKISALFLEAFLKKQERLFQLQLEELPMGRKQLPHPFAKIFRVVREKTTDILEKNRFFSQKEGSHSAVYLSENDIHLIEAHALPALSSETKELEKNLFILSTVVTLAPFLGLLGTVWGILITFSEMTGSGSIASNSAVLGGLSTALTTTVLGLLIAIPALVAHNYLRASVRYLSSDMEDFLSSLLSTIELQYRKADIS